jgi:hypothetical protein
MGRSGVQGTGDQKVLHLCVLCRCDVSFLYLAVFPCADNPFRNVLRLNTGQDQPHSNAINLTPP